MTPAQACAMRPTHDEGSRHYMDSTLTVATETDFATRIESIVGPLSALDFEEPLVIEVESPVEGMHKAAVQTGCRNMTMAIVEDSDEAPWSRFVSVLEDGFVVITSAPKEGLESQGRFGSSGTYQVASTDQPIDFLAMHLERSAQLAEKRNTAVVVLEGNEWRDVYQYTRRVLFDIRNQYGEINYDVGSASHGRFKFPPQRVATLATTG